MSQGKTTTDGQAGQQQRIVVMTGATSGFGAHTVQRIAAQPDTRVIIGARGSGRTAPPGVEILKQIYSYFCD